MFGGLAPGRWPGAWSCRPGRLGHGRVPGGLGQAANLVVTHPVEDQGEQLAGGSDLGDVLGFLPAAADDGVLAGARPRVAGDALDGLDQRPAQEPRALLCDVPAGYLGVGLAVTRRQAGP